MFRKQKDDVKKRERSIKRITGFSIDFSPSKAARSSPLCHFIAFATDENDHNFFAAQREPQRKYKKLFHHPLSLRAKVIVLMLICIGLPLMFRSAAAFSLSNHRVKPDMLIECDRLVQGSISADIEHNFLQTTMTVIRPIDCAIDTLQFNHKLRVKFLYS